MKITVVSSKTVKPAYGHVGLARRGGTNGETVPLTVLDKANFDAYISIIYAFRPPMPPNSALEAGLAQVLAVYPEWAGRLGVDADGNRAIRLNDEGARFVEARADDATLDSVLPLKPTAGVWSLHPSGDGAEELMLIQVTRFTCGSVVVGFTTHHVVADGHATSNFFVAWSQATRGAAINPAPVHDRRSLFKPRDPPQVQFEHRGAEFKASQRVLAGGGRDDDDEEVVMHKVHFTREKVLKLKSLASPPGGGQRPCSTTRCVVAHLWRCMTVARGLRGSVATTARIAVDGRARMTPPVPNGYTGNVVLWARPAATAQELVMNPLHHAVELIDRELARLDDGYFRSFIDFASSGAVERERLVPTADVEETVLSPNIEVDSWLGIPFCDVDFGGGRPLFFMPSYLMDEGVLILAPSDLGDGSVDAYVTLFAKHMDAFKYCCYSLD